jgi:hypothetical protein
MSTSNNDIFEQLDYIKKMRMNKYINKIKNLNTDVEKYKLENIKENDIKHNNIIIILMVICLILIIILNYKL